MFPHETLILGEHAASKARSTATTSSSAGRFDGTIRAKGKVEIQTNAIVTGEIHTPCLIIEPGAIFDGHCHMLSTSHVEEPHKPITIPIRSAAAQA